MAKKRPLSFAMAAVVCCVLLFVLGIGFGFGDRSDSPLTSSKPNQGRLIDRINVVAPKFGHAPVRAATIETCKQVLRKLPTKVYRLLEDNNATINLAPNIEDNWPGSGDGDRPGSLDMTMGEESGRCYGRDVWLYEAEKVRGSQQLKTPRSQDTLRANLYQLLGHAINDCMGVVTNSPELIAAYNQDLESLPFFARIDYIEESQEDEQSRALGCSEIIGVLIGGQGHHNMFPILKNFPRTAEYLKKQML
jgi:hypothetical protein